MKYLTNLGLYLHIPFCEKKCAYCDFYSAVLSEELVDRYLNAISLSIKEWGGKINRPIDTIYLGGGSPSVLNHRIIPLLNTVKENFYVKKDAEITLEVNPQNNIKEILSNARKAGVNRISIGAQSGLDAELKTLGRNHTANDTENAVKIARNLGFSNISLDLMLGLPNSNLKTLKQSLDFIISQNPEHISCYILKIEPNTAFFKNRNNLNLPSEDDVCDQYLFMCEYLKKNGFSHYEISNFCKDNKKGLHNLKYWHCEEYLGIGPSAHSFVDKKRFFYPRDLKQFLKGVSPSQDSTGGERQEKIMLALRLSEGVPLCELPKSATEKCRLFVQNSLAGIKNGNFVLTDKGMLVSNAIISEILEEI